MVTCPLWCSRAARSISMRTSRDTRTPSVVTTAPSTFTQPLVIQRSASRREHRPSSPMSFERRGKSGLSGDGGGRVILVLLWYTVAPPLKSGNTSDLRVGNGRSHSGRVARSGHGRADLSAANPFAQPRGDRPAQTTSRATRRGSWRGDRQQARLPRL